LLAARNLSTEGFIAAFGGVAGGTPVPLMSINAVERLGSIVTRSPQAFPASPSTLSGRDAIVRPFSRPAAKAAAGAGVGTGRRSSAAPSSEQA